MIENFKISEEKNTLAFIALLKLKNQFLHAGVENTG